MKAGNRILISCAHAAVLIDKRHTSGLTFSERFKLSVHSRICAVCVRYNQQQKWIDEALELLNKREVDPQKAELLKTRILDAAANA